MNMNWLKERLTRENVLTSSVIGVGMFLLVLLLVILPEPIVLKGFSFEIELYRPIKMFPWNAIILGSIAYIIIMTFFTKRKK